MVALFAPGGAMDYQRSYGTNGYINSDYVDFGNYNYGVVSAAAGYTEEEALFGAGVVNSRNIGNPNVNTSGPYFSNPRNNQLIQAGYEAYEQGTICH